jgi:hypothetical protein
MNFDFRIFIVNLTMGIRVNGYVEEIYGVNSPIRIITVITLAITLVSTLCMMYMVAYRNFVGKTSYARLLCTLFTLSTIHQVLTFLFLFFNTPAILDWFLSFSGVCVVHCLGISNGELLCFFAPLTHFWNKKRVRILQVFWLLFSFFCVIEMYVKLGYIGQELPALEGAFWLPQTLGTSLIMAIVNLHYILQSLWILSLLYRHMRVTKKDALKLRVPKMIQFVLRF